MRLPLAQLEFTRTGRSKNTYRLRLAAPAFCASVMLAAWGIMTLTGSNAEDIAAFNSGLISYTVLIFQLFVAFLYTPLLASGTIAREKQERTLGLLLLTRVKETDVLAAKGLSVFLQAELLLLGCLPLQAIASLFGGLTLEMMIGQQVALAAICAVLTSLGLFCSTLSSRPMDALAFILGGEVVWLLVSSIVDGQILVPMGMRGLSAMRVLEDTFDPSFSWLTVAIFVAYAFAFAFLLFGLARLALRGSTESRRSRLRGRRRSFASLSVFDRIPWLRLDPVGKIYAATVSAAGGILYRWPWWLVVLIVSCIFGLPGAMFFWLVIVILIVNDVSTSLSSAQNDGSMDLLFVTSADDKGIVRAIYRTHLRRAYLFLPALFFSNVFFPGFRSMGPTGGLLDSFSWEVRYAAVGGLAFLESWIEASAYVSLACACVTRFGSVGRQVLSAFASLLGIHIATVFLSTLVGLAVVSIFFNDVLDNSLPPRWIASNGEISKSVYLAVLLGMSYSWREKLRVAIERRWRVGEPLDQRNASRFLPRATGST